MKRIDHEPGDRLEREANRQGASDGRNGYRRNPGDWAGRCLAAYDRGYVQGRDAA